MKLATSRRLLSILAINVVWLGLLLWSSTETLPVSVVVQPNQVIATVGQTTVAAPTTASDDGVGFFLQGADSNAVATWTVTPTPSHPALFDLPARLAAESAWTNPRIVESNGTTVTIASCLDSSGVAPSARTPATSETCPTAWYGDWFRHPLGGLTTEEPGEVFLAHAASVGGTYTLKANLLRPRNAAGLLVDAPDAANGMLLYFRPEDRDIVWYKLENGSLVGPVASAPFNSFNKDAVSGIQDVLRELLGGYPAALVIVLATALLGRGLTPGPSPSEMERGGERPAPLSPFPPLQGAAHSGQEGRTSVSHSETAARSFPLPLGEGQGEDVPSSSTNRISDLERGTPIPAGESADVERGLVPRKVALNGHSPATSVSDLDIVSAEKPHDGPSEEAQVRSQEDVPNRPRAEAILTPPRSVSAVDGLPSVLAILIALAGLGLFLYVADVLLERIPHVQDSVAYLFQAKTLALGRLWVPTPPDPNSFMHEFIIMKDGRWFSKYPPGWPMVLALGVLAGAPWVVDPILGALCLYLLYRIGREVDSVPVGLLAALLGLAAPFVIFLSGSMMAHTSGLFFTLLMVYGIVRLERGKHRLAWGIAIGVAFGMLFLVRPFSGLMVALPFAILAVVQIVQTPTDSLRKWLPAVVAMLPFVLGFLVYNKIFTGSFTYPPQQLWWPFDQVGFGPDHGPFGFTPINGLNNTARNLAQLLSHGYGWPAFLTLSLASIPFLTGRAKTWDWLFLGGFLFLVVGYACWWADGIMYGPRFYFEGFGYLILLTARGAAVAVGSAGEKNPEPRIQNPESINPLSLWERVRVRASPSSASMALLIIALVAYNLVFYMPGQWQLYQGYNFTNRQRQDIVEKNDVHNAVVFVDPGPWYAWWDYGSVFSANDPLLDGDVIYARDLGTVADQQVEQDFPTRSAYLLKGNEVILLSPPQKPHPTFCGPNCPSRG